ncbi:uncharacterized protein BDV14DRAFT_56317 [Aspergillus stella-maris]|uniref:uncharacterized protein n=1 Tax=Aspergillus stella-maris TaxID=1810926 RepID=UPI003CCD8312
MTATEAINGRISTRISQRACRCLNILTCFASLFCTCQAFLVTSLMFNSRSTSASFRPFQLSTITTPKMASLTAKSSCPPAPTGLVERCIKCSSFLPVFSFYPVTYLSPTLTLIISILQSLPLSGYLNDSSSRPLCSTR